MLEVHKDPCVGGIIGCEARVWVSEKYEVSNGVRVEMDVQVMTCRDRLSTDEQEKC